MVKLISQKGKGMLFIISMGLFLPSGSSLFTALFLFNVQHSVAARAGVVCILEVLQEERNQAAAAEQPAADEE